MNDDQLPPIRACYIVRMTVEHVDGLGKRDRDAVSIEQIVTDEMVQCIYPSLLPSLMRNVADQVSNALGWIAR